MELSAKDGAKKRKKFEFPRPFAVMMILVLIFSILSYVIPSSSYEMMDVTYLQADGTEKVRSVVNPETWALSEEDLSVSFMQYMTSFIRGLVSVADIVFCIFIVVGAFYIVSETGAITACVGRLIIKMGNKKFLIIPIMMAVFAVLGSTVGCYEEMLCFIPILAPMLIAAGYDSLIVIGVVMGGGAAGFAGAVTNPFTLGVAQGIAGLPMFSGIGFRVGVLIAFIITLGTMLVLYAKRLEKDQTRSLMYEMDKVYVENNAVDFSELPELTGRRKAIMGVVVASIVILIYGVMNFGWYFNEITALFMTMGIVVTVVDGHGINWFCDTLVAGMKTIVTGAMMCGFARAILVVLEDAQMLHTILHAAAGVVQKLPEYMAAVGQYIFQCLMNYIIPSGSGQATATMPLMAALSDLTGVNRQVAVQCCVIGDALSNPFTPTSGNIHAGLAMAGIPYVTWVKFWWKFLAVEYAVGLVVILIADAINFGPF